MKRISAFEFNDSVWCPLDIRESITEILGATFQVDGIYRGVADEFRGFCSQLGGGVLIDVCSGSGLPAASLLEHIGESGCLPQKVFLSDLFPNTAALQKSRQRCPERLQVIENPVDATCLPTDLDYDAVTMFNSLHHFDPAIVQRIIDGCVENRKAWFFVEAFPRNLRCFLPIFLAVFGPLLRNPFDAPKRGWLKFILTYLLPVIPNALLWDGIVSVLRTHTREEVLAMVRKHEESYLCSFTEIPMALGGRVTVFSGIPIEAREEGGGGG